MTTKEHIILRDAYNVGKLPKDYADHYFTHILCHSGWGQFQINNQVYSIRPNEIAIWLPSAGITHVVWSLDFKADFFLMSYEIASKNNPDISWGIKGYLFSKEHPVVLLSEKDKQKYIQNIHALCSINDHKEHRFRDEILNLHVQIFILDMWNIFARKIEERLILSRNRSSIFERFLNLAEAHCMEHRELAFYSDKLCITTKYLTELCKKSSGKTASEWIQNYMTQRIIILLKDKKLNFTEIADALHFSSPSFFSRYVRNVLGISPSEFRQRLR